MTKRHMGRMSHEDRGRGWSDAVVSQGMPRIAGRHQKVEEARKGSVLKPSEEGWPCLNLDFGCHTSSTVREYISTGLSYPFYGTLLQQPREINTPVRQFGEYGFSLARKWICGWLVSG